MRFSIAQVSKSAPADQSLQPSISKLLCLAQLRVGGHIDVGRCYFPPEFGSLSALTSLTLFTVRRLTA
jgi:hypothetical protein